MKLRPKVDRCFRGSLRHQPVKRLQIRSLRAQRRNGVDAHQIGTRAEPCRRSGDAHVFTTRSTRTPKHGAAPETNSAGVLPESACARHRRHSRRSVLSRGVDAKNVILETVKQAEDGDGVIVRLYRFENARTTTKLHWNRPIASVTECDLQENAAHGWPVEGGTFKFTIKPYEIKTFRIR